jgi:uncharacterized protein (TIGR02118 family)
MIKVSVFFPLKPWEQFNSEYFFSKHLPMIVTKLGKAMKGLSVEKGVSGALPGSAPSFVMMAHFLFESLEAFHKSFGPHAEVVMADVIHFTSIEPVVQISEVKYSL